MQVSVHLHSIALHVDFHPSGAVIGQRDGEQLRTRGIGTVFHGSLDHQGKRHRIAHVLLVTADNFHFTVGRAAAERKVFRGFEADLQRSLRFVGHDNATVTVGSGAGQRLLGSQFLKADANFAVIRHSVRIVSHDAPPLGDGDEGLSAIVHVVGGQDGNAVPVHQLLAEVLLAHTHHELAFLEATKQIAALGMHD